MSVYNPPETVVVYGGGPFRNTLPRARSFSKRNWCVGA